MRPGVQQTYFNNIFGEFNLQRFQVSEHRENVFNVLSYGIVLEIPGIKNMLNNEKLCMKVCQ